MKLKNKPGEPIVSRDTGARFYCISCGGTYSRYPKTRQCKCPVYLSADTIKNDKSIIANRGTEAI